MLITLSQALKHAQRNGYAIGAFNINNFETAHAILEAASELSSPVILSTSEGAISYAGMDELGSLVHAMVRKYDIPVVYHLDHGKDIELIKRAIRSGWYTSVMFDGSSLPYEENLAKTRMLRRLAHWHGVSIEAELGAIAGIEDFVNVADRDAHLTNPEQADSFVRKSGCDALAIAIGTSHGAYKFEGSSQLDFARLEAVQKRVHIPLVLHGASGVPEHIKQQCMDYGCKIADAKGVADEHISKAVSLGICKVNIDTDIRIAFDAGVRKYLAENPEVIDPRKIMGGAIDLMKQVVSEKIKLFGSAHRM